MYGFSASSNIRYAPSLGTCSIKYQYLLSILSPPPLAFSKLIDTCPLISSFLAHSSILSPKMTAPFDWSSTNWSLYRVYVVPSLRDGCSISMGRHASSIVSSITSLLYVHMIGDCDPPCPDPCSVASAVDRYLTSEIPWPVESVYSIDLKIL